MRNSFILGQRAGGGTVITRGDGVGAPVNRMVALADGVADELSSVAALDTVRMLAAEYPADPGIVVSLLLNRVALRRGETLYLPAGNIHAHLSGLGIELMTASDNVLREATASVRLSRGKRSTSPPTRRSSVLSALASSFWRQASDHSGWLRPLTISEKEC